MSKKLSIKAQIAARQASRSAGFIPLQADKTNTFTHMVVRPDSRSPKRDKSRAPGAAQAAEERHAVLAMAHWVRAGIPAPARQFKFHPERKWRFDFAWPEKNGSNVTLVAIEVQGGNFMRGGGAHARGGHLRKEYEKWRAAAELGWRILPVLPEQLLGREFTEQLKRILTADERR